jgi:hypothetical protein
MDRAGVILVGSDGTTIGYNIDVPGPTWTRYTVPLSPTGWHMGDRNTGDPVTENDLRSVLASLENVQILGEWQTSPDRSELDNVVLRGSSVGGTQEIELAFDDDSFESFSGFSDGTGIQANGPFIPLSYPATLTQAKFLTNGSQEGTEVYIHFFMDPTGAADRPSRALIVGTVSAIIGPGDMFQSVDMSSLGFTLTTGNFFIGIESLGQASKA